MARHKFESAVARVHRSPAEVLEKLDFDAYYALSSDEKPKGNDEILRKFVALGFLKDDMEEGYDITNLGAILFARDLTLFPSVAMKSARVIQYVGRLKVAAVTRLDLRAC